RVRRAIVWLLLHGPPPCPRRSRPTPKSRCATRDSERSNRPKRRSCRPTSTPTSAAGDCRTRGCRRTRGPSLALPAPRSWSRQETRKPPPAGDARKTCSSLALSLTRFAFERQLTHVFERALALHQVQHDPDEDAEEHQQRHLSENRHVHGGNDVTEFHDSEALRAGLGRSHVAGNVGLGVAGDCA